MSFSRAESDGLVDSLFARGVTLIAGVPCSYFGSLFDSVTRPGGPAYLPASNEGEAVALAAGAWLAGGLGVVICQNSGLGNMVSPLTSLLYPFKIPILMLVTWRGEPGHEDEPQHEQMGRLTPGLLEFLEISTSFLPGGNVDVSGYLDEVFANMSATGRSHAIIVRRDDFDPSTAIADIAEGRRAIPLAAPRRLAPGSMPTRMEALQEFVRAIPPEAAVIATTGKSARELFTIGDSERYLYCVGAMGYASALAHGLALATRRRIYVLDGDGAAIMHLGNLATIGASNPQNLVHIVLDNGSYDSTGGQPTNSASVDFAAIAGACGYADVVGCGSLEDFAREVASSDHTGSRFIHLSIQPGSLKKLGRPDITPEAVGKRMRDFIRAGGDRQKAMRAAEV
jgi:phosphonopyruvate decarboxylase